VKNYKKKVANQMFEEFMFMENDWLEREYGDLELVRSVKYFTMKMAMNLFLQNGGNIIVETGTQRVIDDPGGCSTLLFSVFAARYGKEFYTVDNVERHMDVAKQATEKYKDSVQYILSDSVKFLREFDQTIDLLYLDSMDCPFPPGDAVEAQKHNLEELKMALPKLKIGSVLLIDDNNFENGGKTRLTKNFLLTLDDWFCLLDHGQTIWLKVK
jgi:predicted O-methyltransferase YrrM